MNGKNLETALPDVDEKMEATKMNPDVPTLALAPSKSPPALTIREALQVWIVYSSSGVGGGEGRRSLVVLAVCSPLRFYPLQILGNSRKDLAAQVVDEATAMQSAEDRHVDQEQLGEDPARMETGGDASKKSCTAMEEAKLLQDRAEVGVIECRPR